VTATPADAPLDPSLFLPADGTQDPDAPVDELDELDDVDEGVDDE
jgi:hypothetical protein